MPQAANPTTTLITQNSARFNWELSYGDLFVFDVQTSGTDDTFTLPLVSGGTYNFVVDWGDGQSDTITAWNAAAKTHTYADEDLYEIRIDGTLVRWRHNNDASAPKVRELKNWGCLVFDILGYQFRGCSNMTVTATDAPGILASTVLYFAFSLCSESLNFSISNWDTANIISFRQWLPASSVWNNGDIEDESNKPLTNLDVSNVQNFTSMFTNSAFNQDISNWNTSEATDMTSMLRQIDFNHPVNTHIVNEGEVDEYVAWDVRKVTTVNSMFNSNSSFNQSLSNWNLCSCTNYAFFLILGTLSTANYDATLIGWADRPEHSITKYEDGGGGKTLVTANGHDLLNNNRITISDSDSYGPFDIQSFADAGGGQVTVGATGHTIAENDYVLIKGTADYNGRYQATNVAANTFEITKAFTATETGSGRPDLIVSDVTTNTYKVNKAYVADDGATTGRQDLRYAPTGPVHFGSSKYTSGGAAQAARSFLIDEYGWSFTDGGAA
jgi:surface protein